MDAIEKLLFKGNIKYDEASLILFFISLEITNLLTQIRDKSPEASRIVPKDAFILTPEQIDEARAHETNFVKEAISVTMQRQEALNRIVKWIDQIDKLCKQIQAAATTIAKEKSALEETQKEQLNANLIKLTEQKNQLQQLKIPLQNTAEKINALIAKHAKDWQKHYAKFADELILEFEKHNLKLSDLEKQEIRNPTKSIQEIEAVLQQLHEKKK